MKIIAYRSQENDLPRAELFAVYFSYESETFCDWFDRKHSLGEERHPQLPGKSWRLHDRC